MPSATFAWTVNPPGLILLLVGIGLVALAWRGWRLPAFPGRSGFVGMLSAAAWWATAAALENMAVPSSTKILWAEMAWPGIVATPIHWALFVWAYCKGEERIRGPAVRRLATAVPLLVWAVALSNDWHGLLYPRTTPMAPEPGSPIAYDHGAAFYAIVVGLYVMMLFSMVVVVDAAQRAPALYRRHYLGFALAMLFPWTANIGYVTGTMLLFGFDPTPFSFLLMGSIFYWLISRRQLFDLLPVAHRTLLDALPDVVMVLDGDGMVVEANAAATGLAATGLAGAELAGARTVVGKRLADLPTLARLAGDGSAAVRDVALNPDGEGHGERYFEARFRTIAYEGRPVGRVVVLTDITDRKLVEERLKEQLEANIGLQNQLREQATRDLLTGLGNRRALEEIRPLLLAGARSAGAPLSVVLIDLDRFKSLNDRWGHGFGDEVLRTIADFLRSRVRRDDVLVRMGGEEILILLPGTEPAQAELCVERWREEFAARPFAVRGCALTVTFSAGIASFPSDGEGWDQLMHRADMALYRAKNLGRNRTCRWTAAGVPVPDAAGP